MKNEITEALTVLNEWRLKGPEFWHVQYYNFELENEIRLIGFVSFDDEESKLIPEYSIEIVGGNSNIPEIHIDEITEIKIKGDDSAYIHTLDELFILTPLFTRTGKFNLHDSGMYENNFKN